MNEFSFGKNDFVFIMIVALKVVVVVIKPLQLATNKNIVLSSAHQQNPIIVK